ncbi:hypothetical protein SAMN02910298_01701 [Pseudobutyrivibrio sp. YE44]|uniref:DUF5979 domain-containing protein n=1 Tax=Pseudobutyrivibrio sp. YE44 TaxID=1520802 RepID=UPI00088F5705|nr:DUF5979 domain-containing protein [Pseudobutyrivibrio sp. YE44]SDB34810.1 hypothetical protein SAMN02910298_01701 [Pseudobutyrivibrio sp. YE44]
MSTLGFKKKNIIAAVAAVVMLVSGFGVYKTQAAGHVDQNATVTITAIVESTGESDFAQKYTGPLNIEIYKIASLDIAGNPTVTSDFKNAGIDFSILSSKTSVEDTKDKIVNPAAEYVKKNHDSLKHYDISGTKTSNGFTSAVSIEKGAGIYLYYVSDQVMDAENEYIFTPAVFYAPTSEYAMSGQGSDTWNYNVKIYPKAEANPRFGKLEIEKTLTTFNRSLGTASFVFQVDAKVGDEDVLNNVYTINFNGAGTKNIVIENLPATAEVTVTEVYSGASYQITSEDIKTTTIVADKTAKVSFVNDFDNHLQSGGVSVVNEFTYDEEGNISWSKNYGPEGPEVPQSTEASSEEVVGGDN